MAPVRCFGVCLLVVSTRLTALQAQVVLYDTTGNNVEVNWLVGVSPAFPDTINQPAAGFTVTGGDFFLDSLTLGLAATQIETDGEPGDYEVRVWDNSVDRPSRLLESLTVPDSSLISELVLLTSSSHPVLYNGGTYWVSVALPDDVSNGGWVGVSGPAESAVAFSSSVVVGWTPLSPDRAVSLRVLGIPVPEPSTIAQILVCNVLTLSYTLRHRVRARAFR